MAELTRININEALGYSNAIRVSKANETIYVAGQISSDDAGNPLHPNDMAKQAEKAMDNLEAVLAASGATLANICKMNIYVTDVAAFMAVAGSTIGRLVTADCMPASTLIGVASLIYPEVMIEIEAIAVL